MELSTDPLGGGCNISIEATGADVLHILPGSGDFLDAHAMKQAVTSP
jgi:hypothetical protein